MEQSTDFVRGEFAALDSPTGDIIKLLRHIPDRAWEVEFLNGKQEVIPSYRVHEID